MTRQGGPKRLRAAVTTMVTAVLLAVLLTSCGGGGGTDGGGGVGSGGTGAFSSGTISGFGSVIVNGVRFDDREARIEDENGTRRGRDDLRLGQVAEIESGAITAGTATELPTATASVIRYGSALLGRVDSIDATRNRLVVLGQTVRLGPNTVFDDALAGGLSALRAGDVAEVYGFFDAATAGFVATRLERRGSVPPRFKVRGLVSSVDAAGRTFEIGRQVFSVDATQALPANGQLLRVEIETEAVGGRWVVDGARNAVPALPDTDEAEIEGLITRFESIEDFEVDGVPVTTSAGTGFSDGKTGLKLGARVEVDGPIVGGVLRAREVSLEDDDDEEESEFEVSGQITSVDLAARSFTLRGVIVDYDAATEFDDGRASDLQVGREVEVTGVLSADRTRLRAQEVEFE